MPLLAPQPLSGQEAITAGRAGPAAAAPAAAARHRVGAGVGGGAARRLRQATASAGSRMLATSRLLTRAPRCPGRPVELWGTHTA